MAQQGYGLSPTLVTALDPNIYFPYSCTFQSKSTAQAPSGQPTPVLVDVPGLVGIRCRQSALVRERPSDDVFRSPTEVDIIREFHLVLQGYYPAVTIKMVCLLNGIVYRLSTIQHGDNRITRLRISVANS